MKRSVRKLKTLMRMATGYAEYADATPMQAVDQSAAAVAVPCRRRRGENIRGTARATDRDE